MIKRYTPTVMDGTAHMEIMGAGEWVKLEDLRALVEALIAADKYIDKGHFQMARNITRAAITALAPFTEINHGA